MLSEYVVNIKHQQMSHALKYVQAKRSFAVSVKTPKGTEEKATLKGTTGMACLYGSTR
jgi:hypothetical protein